MRQALRLKTSLLAITAAAVLLTLSVAQAAPMAKIDYTAAKAVIGDTFKTDKAACGTQNANAKDICLEEAKAKQKNALATLEFGYTGKAADGTKARVVEAEGAYAVAKERCDDRVGNDKSVCVKEAQAVKVKALADAKLVKQVRDARSDAAAEVRDADYKVAVEKCDATTGDAKAACVSAAKMKFGKT